MRSPNEALAALAGRADIIDIKEPGRGSLGMADAATISQIVAAIENVGSTDIVPVSVALGELSDWLDASSQASGWEAPRLPAGVRFAKLGLAGLAGRNAWEEDWRRVQAAFDHAAGRRLEWVAVVYADWKAAGAPDPIDVAEAAARSGCRVVLIDTYLKNGATLLDCLSAAALVDFARTIRQAGLQTALAGGLDVRMIGKITPVQAEIVGIRTAACRQGKRTGEVCRHAVDEFKRALEESRHATFALAPADHAG